MNSHSARVEYSEDLLRRAVRRFWRGKIGAGLPLATLAMLVFFVYLVVSGNRSWLVGMVGTVVVFSIALMATVYVSHLRNSMARLRAMDEPTATLTVSDDMLRLESDGGASEFPWSSIVDLWAGDEFWLVFLDPNQFFTIPVQDLDPEFTRLLRAKIKQALSRGH